jgi:proteasome lid subunit RPN8/RPN11
MTDPGFRVENVHRAAPFRTRTAFAGYQAFGEGNWAVLVEPQTAEGLRDAAYEAYPKETGGLLCGRTLRDHDGQYVLVSGFVQAGPGAGRSAAFEISPQQTAELREEAHRAYPTGDVVGWWHSHPAHSSYSQTDLGTQAIFTQPDSVGLLVFARGEPWAMAYMGPEARKLGYSTVMRVTGPTRAAGNGPVVADPPADQSVLSFPDPPAPGHRTWTPPDRSQRLLRLVIFTESALILVLILVGAMAITVFGLPSRISSLQQASGQISSGEQQVAGQIGSMHRQLSKEIKGAATGLPAPPSVSFGCAAVLTQNGQYSGSFSCDATPSVSTGKILWYLDGRPAGTGGAVKLKVPLTTGAHRVQAILEASGGRYESPAQQLP